jgi:hypothetical protein
MQVKQRQNKEWSSNYQILTGKERPRINEQHEGKFHLLARIFTWVLQKKVLQED